MGRAGNSTEPDRSRAIRCLASRATDACALPFAVNLTGAKRNDIGLLSRFVHRADMHGAFLKRGQQR